MKKPIKQRVKERPVRLAGVILALFMYVLAVIPGEEPSFVVQAVTLAAPLVAALVAERFTFSQAFLKQVMVWIGDYGTVGSVTGKMAKADPRLARGHHGPPPRDRGVSDIVAVLVILIVVLLVIFLFVPRLGR